MYVLGLQPQQHIDCAFPFGYLDFLRALCVFLPKYSLVNIFKYLLRGMVGAFDLFALNKRLPWFVALIYNWTAKFILSTCSVVHISLAEKLLSVFLSKS